VCVCVCVCVCVYIYIYTSICVCVLHEINFMYTSQIAVTAQTNSAICDLTHPVISPLFVLEAYRMFLHPEMTEFHETR
jgi:hypothetical protein